MDLSQHDMDELKMAAEKARAFSPYVTPTVTIEAEKLLALIEQVEEHRRFLSEEQRLYDEETEQTIKEQEEEIQKLRDRLIAETE